MPYEKEVTQIRKDEISSVIYFLYDLGKEKTTKYIPKVAMDKRGSPAEFALKMQSEFFKIDIARCLVGQADDTDEKYKAMREGVRAQDRQQIVNGLFQLDLLPLQTINEVFRYNLSEYKRLPTDFTADLAKKCGMPKGELDAWLTLTDHFTGKGKKPEIPEVEATGEIYLPPHRFMDFYKYKKSKKAEELKTLYHLGEVIHNFPTIIRYTLVAESLIQVANDIQEKIRIDRDIGELDQKAIKKEYGERLEEARKNIKLSKKDFRAMVKEIRQYSGKKKPPELKAVAELAKEEGIHFGSDVKSARLKMVRTITSAASKIATVEAIGGRDESGKILLHKDAFCRLKGCNCMKRPVRDSEENERLLKQLQADHPKITKASFLKCPKCGQPYYIKG